MYLPHRPLALRGALGLLVLAALAGAGSPTTASFPATVSFRGEVLDGTGRPLMGLHDLALRYFDNRGQLLFTETFAGVVVEAGVFAIELGTGQRAKDSRFTSLKAVFAAHPELALEVNVDGTPQEPRLGILTAGHSLKTRLVAAGMRQESDDQLHWKGYEAPSGRTSIQSGVLAPRGRLAQPPDRQGSVRRRPYTLPVVGPFLSRKVSELPALVQEPLEQEDPKEVNRPRHEALFDDKGQRFGTAAPTEVDPLAGPPHAAIRTPPLSVSFEGVHNVSGVLPPDPEMAVGLKHIVQGVNLAFRVFRKDGYPITAVVNTNSLWAGFGGPCETLNNGDAIFLYDRAADRFVLTQFAVANGHHSVCWAISQTWDPTGTYFLYEVVTPRFPDYFKVGAWSAANNNAYFMGTNSGFQNQYDVFAVDRENMLQGLPARPTQFFQNLPNLMMPADVDSPVGPESDAPGLFYTFRDGGEPYFGSPPTDSLDLYAFDVDWATPANSTLTLVQSFTPAQGLVNFNWTVRGFFVQDCIPQPVTTRGLDCASWWPMQRLVYRNFGKHETLVGTWTVDVNPIGLPDRAAPRWFELRNSGAGWSIYQQGTHSPDTIHRWMPSIAMDGSGNIALGYSRGNASNFASIYYATREASDPLGTLQAEAPMFFGTGTQTFRGSRWGDYSSMEIDPKDDCTFWYTNEYYAATSTAFWRTRIGSFKLDTCGGGIVGGRSPASPDAPP